MSPFIHKMLYGINILPIIKYIACAILLICIILAPSWVARQNSKGKTDMYAVRLGSWLFGWSIIGWLWALYWATRK
ncbi:MAG: superinfection immunity protein [Alphaproteobacteria bacterium]|nr:superinfection immunity protein [Alphaproteobacteria bacterium]